MADKTFTATCDGPLVWFDAGPEEQDGAIVKCAACDYLATTGNFHDDAHATTPVSQTRNRG